MTAVTPDSNVIAKAASSGLLSHEGIHGFDTLGSTSEWLRSHHKAFTTALEHRQAQLCVTDWQQAGIGRRGNVWTTLPGNVTVSILARLDKSPQALLGLSLVTGIAVAQALEESLQLPIMLKWPNDVILNNRKLGGLLTEILPHIASTLNSSNSTRAPKAALHSDVVTGIGVNVKRDENVTSLGIGATSIGEAGMELTRADRDALVGAIAERVLVMHDQFVNQGWSFFASEWSARDWLANKPVSVLRDSSTEHTVARGVNEQGALLIERMDELVPLYGGNVSIRTKL